MKRIALAITAVAALVLPVVATAAPAQATSDTCTTKAYPHYVGAYDINHFHASKVARVSVRATSKASWGSKKSIRYCVTAAPQKGASKWTKQKTFTVTTQITVIGTKTAKDSDKKVLKVGQQITSKATAVNPKTVKVYVKISRNSNDYSTKGQTYTYSLLAH